MKSFTSIFAAALLALFAASSVNAQATQNVIRGTQVRVTLSNGLTTTVAHNGDPFTAVVAEPVFSGNTIILPAGAKIHGTVSSVQRPKWISMFRGGASMNLVFNSVEVESRIFPARMSILSIYDAGMDTSKQRKDISTVEGVVVQERHDVKTDVEDIAIGTAGGSVAGAIFSRIMRGTIIGLVGGSAYVIAKKGKDVELPAQTCRCRRLCCITLPTRPAAETSRHLCSPVAFLFRNVSFGRWRGARGSFGRAACRVG
jgi:hypothetical protein